MKNAAGILGAAAMAALIMVMLSRDAYGYLDPGTTNYVVQLLIAGIVGALFAVKVYWFKLTSVVMRVFGRRPKPTEEDGNNA